MFFKIQTKKQQQAPMMSLAFVCLLLCTQLSNHQSEAVLNGVSDLSTTTKNNKDNQSNFLGKQQELSTNQSDEQEPKNQLLESTTDVSFQYEPNEFVITNRPNQPSGNKLIDGVKQIDSAKGSRSGKSAASPKPSLEDYVTATNQSVTRPEPPKPFILPPPAAPSSTSGRSGRMLDLDALMGEKGRARERSMAQTGNRQSRFLSGGSLDMGNNKKLKIQGFIPIVSVKDDNDNGEQEESSSNQEQSSSPPNQQELAALKHKQRLLQAAQSSPFMSNQMNPELSYAQSSIGHASFGVQRYLQSSENPSDQTSMNYQAAATSYPGGNNLKSSVVDSLKRPLKRLASMTGVSEMAGNLKSQQQQQDCLCVPFYMCKNGFISEASVSKAQIQQMIAQQLQQGPRSQWSDASPDSGAANFSPLSQQTATGSQSLTSSSTNINNQQPQYADSIVPVDERSMGKDLISSMNFASDSIQTNDDKQLNSSDSTSFPSSSADSNSNQSIQNDYQSTNQFQLATTAPNTTDQIVTGDFSQEILGRMLGLRAPARMSSASPSQVSSSSGASITNNCGILRTCCGVPAHMLTFESNGPVNKQPNQPMMSYINQATSQQQPNLQQRYQTSQMASLGQSPMGGGSMSSLPYGFPMGSQQLMQSSSSLNNPNYQDALGNSLAHRSTQFQQLSNQYQQLPSQHTRAPLQVNQIHQLAAPPTMSQVLASQPPSLMQQQQQQQKQLQYQVPKPNTANMMRQQLQQIASSVSSSQQTLRSPLVGARKILDGRCGLRQSTGITGRVQNLQYQETSADFGEYPSQAAILKKLGGSDSLFVCGGTLISQYWVATAAHCIKKHPFNELKIRLGEWDVHRDDEFYPFVEKEIKDVVVHPEFVSGNLINDIALLRLDSPVDPSLPHVNPACLPNLDENFARQRCWVTGWGKDSFGQKGSFQSVLQEVELPVAGHGECEAALRQTRLGPHYRLHPGFICAGGEGGRDACEGDGGSGLYCVQDGIIKVAGLVSWGIGCGQAGVPGVYVNMAHYRTWIENIIAIDEDIYSPYMNTLGNNIISERSNGANGTTTEIDSRPTNITSTTSSPSL